MWAILWCYGCHLGMKDYGAILWMEEGRFWLIADIYPDELHMAEHPVRLLEGYFRSTDTIEFV